jgi:serine/threonine-protein kinase RsbW
MEAVLRLAPSLDDLARLYPWLDEAGADVPAALLPRLHVVLEEAASNVAMHAFPAGGTGKILVRLRTGPDAVELVVEDDGAAFDPTLAPPRQRPADPLETPVGGWGLGLIRRYCPDIGYARRDGRNILTLRFPL